MDIFDRDADYEAFGYIRVSTKKQVLEGESLEVQAKKIQQKMKDLDIKKYFIFEDDGISGTSTDNRIGFKEAIMQAIRKKVKYFVCYDSSRFARNTEDSVKYRGILMKYGIELKFVKGNDFENDPYGTFGFTIIAATDQLHADVTAMKVKDNCINSRNKGKHIHGAPGGYKNITYNEHEHDIVIDSPNFEILRDACLAVLRGQLLNWKQVNQYLIDQNFKHNKMKGHSSVSNKFANKALRNPFYSGYITNRYTNKLVKHSYPTMLTLEQHEKLLNILDKRNPEKRDYRKMTETFPLKHFIICDKCNKYMTAYKVKGGKAMVYDCKTKGCKNARVVHEVHNSFKQTIETVQFQPEIIKLFREVLLRTYRKKNEKLSSTIKDLDKELFKIEEEKTNITNKILKLNNIAVIDRLQTHYEELDRESSRIESRKEEMKDMFTNFEPIINRSVQFLANPLQTWESLSVNTKLLYQKWIYPQGIRFDRNYGIRTTEMCSTYKVIGAIGDRNSNYVTPRGLEPRLLP